MWEEMRWWDVSVLSGNIIMLEEYAQILFYRFVGKWCDQFENIMNLYLQDHLCSVIAIKEMGGTAFM